MYIQLTHVLLNTDFWLIYLKFPYKTQCFLTLETKVSVNNPHLLIYTLHCSLVTITLITDGPQRFSRKDMWRLCLLGPSHSSDPTAAWLVFSACPSTSDSPTSRLPSSSPARQKELSHIKHTRHKLSSTQSQINVQTPNVIKHGIMDCTALPKGRFLWTLDIIPAKTT